MRLNNIDNLPYNTQLSISEIASSKDRQGYTRLSRSSIYRYEAAGKFPKRRKVGERMVYWLAGEVREWLEEQASQDE